MNSKLIFSIILITIMIPQAFAALSVNAPLTRTVSLPTNTSVNRTLTANVQAVKVTEIAQPAAIHQVSTAQGTVTLPNLTINASNMPCPDKPETAIHIDCPAEDHYTVGWPARPYDFKAGDCMSLGKEAEIEAYINQLHDIADSCMNSVHSNVNRWNQQKAAVVTELSSMNSFDPNCEIRKHNAELEANKDITKIQESPEMESMPPSLPMFDASCMGSSGFDNGDMSLNDEGFAYTRLLAEMEQAVNETCVSANVLNEDFVCLCGNIADYVNGMDWVWPVNRDDTVREVQYTTINESQVYRSANFTYDWLLYLNNSWHSVYNPAYIQPCGIKQAANLAVNKAIFKAVRESVSQGPADNSNKVQRDILAIYADTVRQENPGVRNITIRNESVKVDIERKAKLFGFIDAPYVLSIEADDSGVKRVGKPWWLFMASDDSRKVEDDINKELIDARGQRLQNYQDKYSKVFQTLSNIMAKMNKTEENITGNIK